MMNPGRLALRRAIGAQRRPEDRLLVNGLTSLT
jgi:hypothetical protein